MSTIQKRIPINLAIGAHVERIGLGTFTSGGRVLKNGDVGKVIEVHPPIQGTGRVIDDDDGTIDTGRDGYAVVMWPQWGRAAIWAKDEGQTWRRV